MTSVATTYSRTALLQLLEKGAFRGYKVNRLLRKSERDLNATLNYDIQNQTISILSHGKTETVKLNKIKKTCSFSRFIYNLRSSSTKDLYIARLQKLVTRLCPASKSASVTEDPVELPFTPEQLITLRAISKKDFSLKSIKYNKELNRLDLLNSALSFRINSSGVITDVYINEVRKDFIPETYFPLLQACIKESSILSSSYFSFSSHIFIKLIDRDLKENPEHHLKQLASHITFSANKKQLPRLLVSPIKDNLKSAIGTDANGISRNYFDNLFASILAKDVIPLDKSKTVLAFPMTVNPFTLSAKKTKSYYQLGQVLMYCYLSEKKQNYCIGQRFDESTFRAAFSLTRDEIETPFNTLSAETYRKLCEELVDAQIIKEPNNRSLERLKFALPVLEWNQGDVLPSDDTLINAYNVLGEAGFDAFDFFTTDDAAMTADLEKIKNPLHLDQFMALAKQALFSINFDKMPPLAQRLAPIHEMAKGMKFLWETRSNPWVAGKIDYVYFNHKVQGSLDRQRIVNMFITRHLNAEVIKKVTWLKEWILHEATAEELQEFLKFMTGSSSLVPGVQLRIDTQTTSPAPISKTCFNSIKIAKIPMGDPEGYNDHTKEAFLKCLKEVCLQGKDPGFTVRF